MMKKLIPLLLCFIVVAGASAQTAESVTLRKHYLKMYNQSLVYNDISTAINALHGYIAEDNNLAYKDTLSMLYFSTKSYVSSLLLSEEVYKHSPANTEAMARAAECYDELGDPKTAVSLWEQVVPKTKNPYHYYKLAIGQYQLKRVAEAEISAKIVIADTSSKRIGVNFTGVDGSQQAVPVNAAAANLLGVLQMDAKNNEGAKTYFKQALGFYPQFTGAKLNLDAVEAKTKGGKTPVKTPTKPK